MIRPKAASNWRVILRRAWSVRLMLLSAVLSGAAVTVGLLDARVLGMDPVRFAAMAGLVNAAALIARHFHQGGIDDDS